MYRKWVGLVTILGILLSGCISLGTLKGSGSGNVTGSSNVDIPGEPLPVAISELSASPADFEGSFLQITGTLDQLPEIDCNTKPRQSPATWALANEDGHILAAGIAEQWDPAIVSQIEITVAGRWQRWIGLSGCGREATPAEVWYLDVTRIVDPNPIAFVSTLPATAAGSTVEQVASDTPIPEGPSLTSTVPTSTSTGTVTPAEMTATPTTVLTMAATQLTPADSTPAGIPSAAPSPTVPTATSGAATSLPSATSSPPAGSATIIPTESTVEVTVPPTSPPLETSTLPAPIVRDQIDLEVSSLETGFLEFNEIHRWPLTISDTNVITVNVASEIGLDVAVKVSDASGNILGEQDAAIGNEPEILAGVDLPEAGTYDILIEPSANLSGNYAILVNDLESYPFVFQGTLAFGDQANSFLEGLSDHFWHFSGTAGEIMSVVITPGGDYDLFLRLFGPDGTLLIEFHDENAAGEQEALDSYEFPDTGLYSLLVGELTFQPAEYDIVLTQG